MRTVISNSTGSPEQVRASSGRKAFIVSTVHSMNITARSKGRGSGTQKLETWLLWPVCPDPALSSVARSLAVHLWKASGFHSFVK